MSHLQGGIAVITGAGSGFGLECSDLADAGGREAEQLVEGLACERVALGGRLHLDEAAVAGHHDVHVGVGADVLLVGQVQPRDPVDDPHRHGGDRPGHILEVRGARAQREFAVERRRELDRLAALVAHLVHADALVLLSDVDSVYTGPPAEGGTRIEHVRGSEFRVFESVLGGGGVVDEIWITPTCGACIFRAFKTKTTTATATVTVTVSGSTIASHTWCIELQPRMNTSAPATAPLRSPA